MPEKKEIQSVVLSERDSSGNFTTLYPITTTEHVILNMQNGETLKDYIDRVAPAKLAHISWISSDMCPSLLDDEGILSGQNIYDITGKKMQDFGIKDLPPVLFDTQNIIYYNRYSATFLRLYATPGSLTGEVSYQLYKYNGLDNPPEKIDDRYPSIYKPRMYQYPVWGSDPKRSSARLLPRFDELFSVVANRETGGWIVNAAFVSGGDQKDTFSIGDPTYANVQFDSLNRSESHSSIYVKNLLPMPNSPQFNMRKWELSSQPSRDNSRVENHKYHASPIKITENSSGHLGNSMADTMVDSFLPRREIQCVHYDTRKIIILSIKHGDSRFYFETFTCTATGTSVLNCDARWKYRDNKSYILPTFRGTDLSKKQITDYIIYKGYIYILLDQKDVYRFKIHDSELTNITEALEFDEIFGKVELPHNVSAIEVCDSGLLCKNCQSHFFGSYFYHWERKANRKIYYWDIGVADPNTWFGPPAKYHVTTRPRVSNYQPQSYNWNSHATAGYQLKHNGCGICWFGCLALPKDGRVNIVKYPIALDRDRQSNVDGWNFDLTTPIISNSLITGEMPAFMGIYARNLVPYINIDNTMVLNIEATCQ